MRDIERQYPKKLDTEKLKKNREVLDWILGILGALAGAGVAGKVAWDIRQEGSGRDAEEAESAHQRERWKEVVERRKEEQAWIEGKGWIMRRW
jgi:hypothetical protein